MTKVLKINTSTAFAVALSAVILLSILIAFPAKAQTQIAENCTLSRAVKISIPVAGSVVVDNDDNDIVSIYSGSFVSAASGAMDGTRAATGANRIRVTTQNEAAPPVLVDLGADNLKPGTNATGAISTAQRSAIANKWGTVCLINTINTLSDWAFFILLTISFVFIAIAGFMWMTSAGNAEKQGTAGKMILAALVGIVIAVLARVVPAVLTGVLI